MCAREKTWGDGGRRGGIAFRAGCSENGNLTRSAIECSRGKSLRKLREVRIVKRKTNRQNKNKTSEAELDTKMAPKTLYSESKTNGGVSPWAVCDCTIKMGGGVSEATKQFNDSKPLGRGRRT